MRFDSMQRHAFNVMGRSAVYEPPVGSSVELKVVRQGGGNEQVGGIVRERLYFHVLRADVPAPAVGATLTLEDDSEWLITAAQPVRNDAHQLKWCLDASWGAEVVWVSKSADKNPATIYGTVTVSAVGANSLSLSAAYIQGKLAAGDTITVDGVEYAAQGAVVAANNALSSVIVDPVPTATVGQTAVIGSARSVPIYVGVSAYSVDEMIGGVQAGDVRVSVLAGEAAKLPEEPKVTDEVTGIGPGVLRVVGVMPVYQGGVIVGWSAQCRK